MVRLTEDQVQAAYADLDQFVATHFRDTNPDADLPAYNHNLHRGVSHVTVELLGITGNFGPGLEDQTQMRELVPGAKLCTGKSADNTRITHTIEFPVAFEDGYVPPRYRVAHSAPTAGRYSGGPPSLSTTFIMLLSGIVMALGVQGYRIYAL